MAKLITVEGLDASGKTSIIIPYLKEKLENTDFYADLNEDGVSKEIRKIFMNPDIVTDDMNWRTIAFLSAAARSDLVCKYIIPSLKAGKNVVCDRYVDTSFVYNMESHTTPIDTILNLSTHLVYPHAVIFAYCSYEEMMNRKSSRTDNDHWDISSESAYYEKLNRYQDQLKKRNGKVYTVETSGSIEDTYKKLDQIIQEI